MATNGSVFDACVAATEWLEERGGRVEVAIICGSGLGGLGEMVTDGHTFPFASIPNFPQTTVKGHTGSMRVGLLGGVRCAVLQGRLHPYEGHSMEQVALPVRVAARLGAHTLLVTNAAGGINPTYAVGDIMVIQDHLNLPGIAGLSPLFGANDSRFGVRFPPMADAYDRDLVAMVEHLATKQGLPVHRGVYAMVAGPNYETIAEARALHILGADAVVCFHLSNQDTMVIRTDELLEVAGMLAQDRGLQVTVTKALQGAAVAGACAFIGAMVAGPVGIACGGALGGIVGAAYTKGQFRPLGEVLAELPPAERQQLATSLDQIVSSLQWTDAVALAMFLNQNGDLKERFFRVLMTYVQQNMHAQVHYVD